MIGQRIDYANIEVFFIQATEDSILVDYYGDRILIPRTLLSYRCELALEDLARNEEFELEIPRWKANELGAS